MGCDKSHWSKKAHDNARKRLAKAVNNPSPDTSEVRKRNLEKIKEDMPRY